MDRKEFAIKAIGVVIMTMVAVGLVTAVNPTGRITGATIIVSGFLSIMMCSVFLSGGNVHDDDADRRCVICERYQLYKRKSERLDADILKLKEKNAELNEEIRLMESRWLDDFTNQDKKIVALKSNWEQLTGFISLNCEGRDNPAVRVIKKRIRELELASLKAAMKR
jgi:hypothetical protein